MVSLLPFGWGRLVMFVVAGCCDLFQSSSLVPKKVSDLDFHPWTVTHTQWITAPSRPKPVKLLMLMPPLSLGEIPLSYKHFGKHLHVCLTLSGQQCPSVSHHLLSPADLHGC